VRTLRSAAVQVPTSASDEKPVIIKEAGSRAAPISPGRRELRDKRYMRIISVGPGGALRWIKKGDTSR